MANSQQPTPSVRSSSNYIVVQIDKRAALLFLSGLAMIAAVYFMAVREPYGGINVQAENSIANSAAATIPSRAEGSSVTQRAPSRPPSPPHAEVIPPVEPNTSSDTVDTSASAPQPSPGVSESRTVVVYRSVQPEPSEPSQTDSSAADNLTPNPPADPPPPNSNPAPDPPAAPSGPAAPAIVNGAGAAFPYPLYAKWFDEFHKLHSNVRFNYQAVGSGAGIKQLLQNTIQFGGTDMPMTDEQLATATNPILHVPSVIGAVVPAYHLPGVAELRFTPEILMGVYSGRITNWNDPAIAAANPRANLPNQPIVAIHRADGCSATFIFTDYLSKVSMEWQHTIGKGAAVYWPLGTGGKGNEGVANLLQETPGAIGYLDYLYAVQNQVPFAGVRNQKGSYIKANLESLTAAAAGATIWSDFRASISNVAAKDAYPISGFTWFLVPQRSRDPSEARDLKAFLHWMLASRSQATASSMGYAPLPEELTRKVDSEISRIH